MKTIVLLLSVFLVACGSAAFDDPPVTKPAPDEPPAIVGKVSRSKG